MARLVPPLELDLTAPVEPVSRIRVEFLTPTELKSGHRLIAKPEFGALAARARDRISTLRGTLWGRRTGSRFPCVRRTRVADKDDTCDIRHVDRKRRSSRTGQVHPIGGFIGQADYEGDLGEFVPYLKVAEWTGVGRQTVWGKGTDRLGSLRTRT